MGWDEGAEEVKGEGGEERRGEENFVERVAAEEEQEEDPDDADDADDVS